LASVAAVAGPWEATTPEGWTVRITQDSFRQRDAYLLERMYRDGSADAGFGRNGTSAFVLGPDNEGPAALRGDATGRWWVAGASVGADNSPQAVVLRFLVHGLPDTSYAVAGRSAVAPAGRGARALDLLPQADGTCWVAGTVVDAQGQERSGWWRLRADGSVDPTFALGGLWSDSTAGATEVVTLAIGDNGVVALGLRRAHAAENQMEVWQLAPGGVMPTLVARSASGTSVAARLIWRDGSWRWLDNAGLALDPPAATASAVAVATAGSALPTPPAPAASAPAGVAIETAVATAVARPDPPTSLLPTALGIALLAAVTGALALWWRRRR